MRIFQILERLRLGKADRFASYHLLSNGPDDLEKGEDAETCCPGLETHDVSAATNTAKTSKAIQRWLRVLRILLPSFLHESSAAQLEFKQPRPTAWLDGLRGIAALFVVLHHMSLIWFPWAVHDGWTNSNDHLIQLPIIRLIVSGRANVMVFFVISGYALSWKPLGLIQKEQPLKMYRALASSTFRRHPRLFIPAIILCAPAPMITYLGGYGGGQGMPGAAIQPMNPPRFDSIWAQFSHYIEAILGLSDTFNPNGIGWIYSDSLWTLPIEFKSSMVVFTMLLALSRCTVRFRVIITLCMALYSLWFVHWGEFLFIGGMLAVEMNLRSRRLADERGSRLGDQNEGAIMRRSSSLRCRAFRRACGFVSFLAVLFVLSMPEQGRGAPQSYGFGTLVQLIPAHFGALGAADYFWQPIAAVLLVLIVDGTRSLQGIFTTRLAQYLGRVSFALYLVHMLILHSLGFYLGQCFLRFTGSESNWQYAAGIGLTGVVVGGIIIWVADLASRFVDANAVRFAAWAYGRLCKPAVEG
ncbi:acyltransferase family-domain-containing protein [Xylaria nigripes]|nr:acyltransferase family-domain-containing protein [Xylaria nigripes]